VIIGILAAVAIPKLFGMTAKAKASEVGPAAGTWSKMHIAWSTEKDTIGTWSDIGYKPPPLGAFAYNQGGSAVAGQWCAKNVTKLNDCIEGTGSWSGKFPYAPDDDSNDLEQPEMFISGTECPSLTPSFEKIGKKATSGVSCSEAQEPDPTQDP